MATTPVTLAPVAAPVQARASLTADQVAAFQSLLGGSSLIALPEGKSVSDISNFVVSVQPNGGGFISVSLK